MNENPVTQEPMEIGETEAVKKPAEVAGLVLGIVAIAAAAFSPLVCYVCGVIGLILGIKNRKTKRKAVAAIVLCAVGLVCGIVSNVISALYLMDTFGI